MMASHPHIEPGRLAAARGIVMALLAMAPVWILVAILFLNL